MVLEMYLLKRRMVGAVWALIKGGFLDTCFKCLRLWCLERLTSQGDGHGRMGVCVTGMSLLCSMGDGWLWWVRREWTTSAPACPQTSVKIGCIGNLRLWKLIPLKPFQVPHGFLVQVWRCPKLLQTLSEPIWESVNMCWFTHIRIVFISYSI